MGDQSPQLDQKTLNPPWLPMYNKNGSTDNLTFKRPQSSSLKNKFRNNSDLSTVVRIETQKFVS
jgi:hypothetical protein